MGLILKHVEKTKSGTWQYRRRVPKAVSSIIIKQEFKQKLGDSEREALKAWPTVHARVESEIAQAQRRLSQGRAAQLGNSTEREAYAEALRRRADLIETGASEKDLEFAADSIADKYPQEDWVPQGATPADRHTINLLRLGPERHRPPEPTLRDALKLYLKEHVRADSADADSRVAGFATRVVETAMEALGRNPLLTAISREDARKVRDHMLDRIKVTGRGVGGKVSVSTVSRELSVLTAVVNFAKTEFDLGEALQNPFSRLPVGRAAKEQSAKASDKRDPLPPEVLEETRRRVIERASHTLALIWRLIEGTGCRIAEVTGLQVEDVDASSDLPHIKIEPNAYRSLKTEASRRLVPLIGDALQAAKEALEQPRTGQTVFPEYGRKRGSDAASAALMKHLRRVSGDEKHVIHSLRHNMKDRLVLAEASSLEQNLILGHALGGVGDRVYGGDVAKLRTTTRAMQRAFEMGADTDE
jgi:integrase